MASQDQANGERLESRLLALSGALLRLTDAHTTHIAHYDSAATAMLQLKGTKDVVLLPHEQVNYTYPWEKGTLLYRRARVNITHPDFTTYPKARKLTPVRLRLHPGDFLIFPSFVPHQPEAITDSISISFRLKTVTHPKKGQQTHLITRNSASSGREQTSTKYRATATS